MKYPAKNSGGDFTPVPAGTYTAVCDMVVDLGMQPGTDLYPKAKRQVYIRFELPAERIDFEKDGKKQNGPAVIGKTYTASMNEKATLRAHLESWRRVEFTDAEAEDFETANLLGRPCTLSIVHTNKNGKTYANIAAIGKVMRGAEKTMAEITPIYYGPDKTSTYAQLPEWLRTKIDGQIVPEPEPEPAPQDDDIPPSDVYAGTAITDDDFPF